MRAGRPWNAFRRHVEPVVEMRIVGDQLPHLGVGARDVLRVARQRRPAERTDAATKQGADISGDEAGKIECVLDAFLQRHLPYVVAVVDRRHAGVLVMQHGAHVVGH
jgi:hypothetical protein